MESRIKRYANWKTFWDFELIFNNIHSAEELGPVNYFSLTQALFIMSRENVGDIQPPNVDILKHIGACHRPVCKYSCAHCRNRRLEVSICSACSNGSFLSPSQESRCSSPHFSCLSVTACKWRMGLQVEQEAGCLQVGRVVPNLLIISIWRELGLHLRWNLQLRSWAMHHVAPT